VAGLADPGPVASALWADEAVEPGAALDAVVTLVDAAHFRQQLAEPHAAEAAAQVAYADVLLLNKTDLVVRGSTLSEGAFRGGKAFALLRC
jgi:G3E family GTPase